MLAILATSLLTVSVFALSTLVAAVSAASASITPRAAQLIVGDRSAQTQHFKRRLTLRRVPDDVTNHSPFPGAAFTNW